MFRFTKEHGYRDPPILGMMQREGMDLPTICMAGNRGEGH